MPKVVTANTLATGHVVFLTADRRWVGEIAEAETFADADAAHGAMEAAQLDQGRSVIVDPFLVDKGPDAGGRPAMSLRDTIRAFGPTIRYNTQGAGHVRDGGGRG